MTQPIYDRATLSSEDHLLYQNKFNFKPRVTNLAKEVLFSLNLCIYFNQKSSIIEEVNKLLLRFIDHGFIKKWVSNYVNSEYLTDPEKKGPIAMNFSHLAGEFQILIFGYALSIFVFLLEKISVRVRWLQRIFKSIR